MRLKKKQKDFKKKRKARKSSKGNIKIGSNVEFLDVALYESAIVNIRFKGQKVRELGAVPLSWANKNQMDTKCNSSKGVEKFFVDFKKISIFAKGMVADNST